MSDKHFKPGDRVRLSPKGRATLQTTRPGSDRGFVVRQHRDNANLYRIHRDGYSAKTLEYYHRDFWVLVP